MPKPQHAPVAATHGDARRAGYDWLDVSFALGVGLIAVCLVAGLAHHLVTRRAWPGTDLDHLALGDEQRDRGDLVGAIREYQMTLLISPNEVRAARRLADAFGAAGLAEQEVEARARLTRMLPGSTESWVSLGSAQLGSGRPEDALRSFDKAIELDQRDAGAHAGRGDALRRLGRRPEALASYAAAAQHSPQDGALLNRAAIVHVEAGDLAGAVRLFREATQWSTDPSIRANLKLALEKQRRAAAPESDR